MLLEYDNKQRLKVKMMNLICIASKEDESVIFIYLYFIYILFIFSCLNFPANPASMFCFFFVKIDVEK